SNVAHRHGRLVLVPAHRAAHAEFAAAARPGGVELLSVNARPAAILRAAAPGNREIAAAVHAGGGPVLTVVRVGVDQELIALRGGAAVVAPGVNPVVAAVLVVAARPGDDE